MLHIYCIIVTYNGMRWLERCLSSLYRSTIQISPIVVDNGSTDGTIEYIRTHFPKVLLLPQSKNLGFGQANNAGIRYALEHGATHVLLLNQDAWIDPNMIEKLLPYSDANSLVSPIHMTGEGDRMDRNFHNNAFLKSKELTRMEQDIQSGHTDRYYTDEINAACWFLPRQILEEVGGFNPLFFHYAEDNDYLQRLHYHHKGIYIVPATHAFHDRANVPDKIPSIQSIYQQLILRAVDIRYNRFQCLMHRWRYALGVLHTALAMRRMNDLKYYCQALSRYHKMYFAVKANRTLLKQKGPHWIE